MDAMFRLKNLISFVFLLLLLATCANRGRPDGGPRDLDPPVIISANPENYSTNFKAEEIRINFNEFIKIKDLQKQLIISPPMKWQPEIIPQGGASKYISIKIKDTLPPNTTYALNFGNSIVDNNEENPYPYFRYVFSTGPTIDSLSVQGILLDAVAQEVDNFVTVMLYEKDSTYTDSIVYKETPRYITNTLDSIKVFSIDNVKAGTYKLVALKDKNNNYLFNPETDKIGFVEGFIEVPKDTLYQIKLFKETLPFEVERPKQVGASRIMFPYVGELEALKIEMLDSVPSDLKYTITKDKSTDSLYYWYKPKIDLDSTRFRVVSKTVTDTFAYKFRGADKDSLTISTLLSSKIDFNQNFTIEGSTPFTSIDTTLIQIIDKDSITVPYTIQKDTLYNRYEFLVDLKEDMSYYVTMYPGALTDFYETSNDTLNYTFGTRKKEDFGNLRMTILNGKLPMIAQLVTDRGEVKYERFAKTSAVVDFTDIRAGEYYFRVIFDTNENDKWDPGNFLQATPPERISYFPELIEVRANFDFIYEFPLLIQNDLDPLKN
jgi:uncharacterized protein (DUF2141 family)